jgi:hypothetical protein
MRDQGLPGDGRRFLAEEGNAHHTSELMEWGSAGGGVPECTVVEMLSKFVGGVAHRFPALGMESRVVCGGTNSNCNGRS